MSTNRPWAAHNFGSKDETWFKLAEAELAALNMPTQAKRVCLQNAVDARLDADVPMLELCGDPEEWAHLQVTEAAEQGQRTFTRPMRAQRNGLIVMWLWVASSMSSAIFTLGFILGQSTKRIGVPHFAAIAVGALITVVTVAALFHLKVQLRRGYSTVQGLAAVVVGTAVVAPIAVGLGKVPQAAQLPFVVAVPQWSMLVLTLMLAGAIAVLPDSDDVPWPSVAHPDSAVEHRRWQYQALLLLVHRCDYAVEQARAVVAELVAEAHEYGDSLLAVHGEPTVALASTVPEPDDDDDDDDDDDYDDDDDDVPNAPKNTLAYLFFPLLQAITWPFEGAMPLWQAVFLAVVGSCSLVAAWGWWREQKCRDLPKWVLVTIRQVAYVALVVAFWQHADPGFWRNLLITVLIILTVVAAVMWFKSKVFPKKKTAPKKSADGAERGTAEQGRSAKAASEKVDEKAHLVDHQHVGGLLRSFAECAVFVSFLVAALWACAVPWSVQTLTEPVDSRLWLVILAASVVWWVQDVVVNRVSMFYAPVQRQRVTAMVRVLAGGLIAGAWWGAPWALPHSVAAVSLPGWALWAWAVLVLVVWFAAPTPAPVQVWSDASIDDKQWRSQFRELMFHQHKQCPKVIAKALVTAQAGATAGSLGQSHGAPAQYIATAGVVVAPAKRKAGAAWSAVLWPVAIGCLSLGLSAGQENWGWPVVWALMISGVCFFLVTVELNHD